MDKEDDYECIDYGDNPPQLPKPLKMAGKAPLTTAQMFILDHLIEWCREILCAQSMQAHFSI